MPNFFFLTGKCICIQIVRLCAERMAHLARNMGSIAVASNPSLLLQKKLKTSPLSSVCWEKLNFIAGRFSKTYLTNVSPIKFSFPQQAEESDDVLFVFALGPVKRHNKVQNCKTSPLFSVCCGKLNFTGETFVKYVLLNLPAIKFSFSQQAEESGDVLQFCTLLCLLQHYLWLRRDLKFY